MVVHGFWCNSRTWYTRCPSCRDRVFFFSCDCGCGVFFDELGPPWPVHDCQLSWAQRRERRRDDDGTITAMISDHVTVSRPPGDFSVEPSVVERSKTKVQGAKPDPIVSIRATRGASLTVIGELRELARRVDAYRATRVPNTLMGRAFLGPIGSQPVGRITVHADGLIAEELRSFTAWVPAEFLSDTNLTRGILVEIALEGVVVETHGPVWFCKSIGIVR